jgi:DNA-binding CsgD family transcriptional regulator
VNLADAHLAAAERLYHLGALDVAAERLELLARESPDASIKAIALGRLAEVAADQGDAVLAARALRDANGLLTANVTSWAAQEVAVGEARLALAVEDGSRLERALRMLERSSAEPNAPDRTWTNQARALTYAASYGYATLEFEASIAYAARGAEALARARAVPPFVRAQFLTTRTVVDFHDVDRVRCIDEECAEVYALGIDHGMAEASASALFNALMFRLYSGEKSTPYSFASGDDGEALRGAVSFGDPMLAAAAAATLGHFDAALEKLQLSPMQRRSGVIDGEVPVTDFHAQLLFLAGRHADAVRAAEMAIRNWQRSRMRCEGIALCVKAQALEALDESDVARRTIGEAIEALQPFASVPHLIAAYRCAYRLTGHQRFRKWGQALADSVRPRASAKPSRLTAREREVAELVLEGRSNPEIGRELGISHRTVATHVESVLRRLDLRARWQITAEHLSAS